MKSRLLFIALNFFVLSISAQEIVRPVRLKTGMLTPSKNLRNQSHLIDSLKKSQYKNRYYSLIQFNKLPDAAERQVLSQAGILLYDYVPGNAFLAEINSQTSVNMLKKDNITGIFTLPATTRISPAVIEELQQPARDPDNLIAISFYGNIDKATAIAELKKAGAQIKETAIQPAHVVFIDATAAVVQKIATLPFVSYLSIENFKFTPLNYKNRGAHAVNPLSVSAGRNLQGSNVTIGVGDGYYPYPHVDLTGRLLNGGTILDKHPTHITGTVVGGGILNPKYKGMAPEASVINKVTADIVVSSPSLVSAYNMVLTNNSYGGGNKNCPAGEYTASSNYIDEQLNTYPSLLHVFASGNEGDDDVCSPFPPAFSTLFSGLGIGKNVLTVGSIDNGIYTISNFSSRGPASDGRLKPELVAGGSGIVSTTPDNGYTAAYGTSCSAPTVTGILALFYERYRQLHGGSNPTAALIKAVACNGAIDMGNPGPDYTYGFGNINARNSVEAIENNTWFTGTLNNGGSTNFTIPAVPAGTAQIKVLLYWSDPAAAAGAASSLVNDLDLTVTTPDATVHHPLVLDPSPAHVDNAAVEGIDNRNNIEQVVINNPAAGNCTVTVKGTGIAQGPQNYVVVYQVIKAGITVEYPFGEETLVPGDAEFIRWNATDANTNTFTLEYSLNNGGTWTTIDNNIAATNRNYIWTVPSATATNTALIRVRRNGTAYSDVSDYNFTILGSTIVTITDTSSFSGHANLVWRGIYDATSYDVMMLIGKNMQVIANTTNTSYTLNGLNKDSTYWVAVRGVVGTVAGLRSIAQCINPKFIVPPADLALGMITNSNIKGRKYTSAQVGIVTPQVVINNRFNTATSGSASISYQVNGGIPVTDTASINLAPYAGTTYTFASGYDFSAPGNYSIKVWIEYPGDTTPNNDTATFTVKHLSNDPIVLNPSFTEGFESAAAQTYFNNTFGFNGLDRCDFYSNGAYGRVRTFVNAGMARTGNRAATLDISYAIGSSFADSLITTFNLSNYISSADDLWLSLYYRNEGINFPAPGNKIWIRGSDRDAWIPVYTLPYSPADFGIYRAIPEVNITQTLAHASPAQTVTSSFQVKCGEEGYNPVSSITPGAGSNGFTFDDITIRFLKDDVGITKLISPANACSLGASEPITVQVKNFSTSTLTNIPISYRINNNTPVTENIISLAPGATITYTFTQTADMSAFKEYAITAWTQYSTDTYSNNDTIVNTISTAPLITSFPYLERFEGANAGNWYTGGANSSWQWGTPSGTVINKAANGNKAWVTNLSGHYNNNELSYLYSPCFDISGMVQPMLSFSHIYKTQDNNDNNRIEYSNDGQTWQDIGYTLSGDYGWWHVTTVYIPTSSPTARFRFVMSSDASVTDEGIGIDDVHVFDKKPIFQSDGTPSHSTKPVSGNSWINFTEDSLGFPGYGLYASINANGQDLGNTDVRVYVNPDSYMPYNDGHQFYLGRNLVIHPTNIPTAPVKIRFYFLDAEVEMQNYAPDCSSCTKLPDAYSAGITQYSNAPAEEDGTLSNNRTGNWRFITPAEVDIIPYNDGYYAEFEVSNFSEFWINPLPRVNQPLPLQLGDFTVSKVTNTALLQWSTYTESNTSQFIIERSTDGINYIAIGTVQASENSNTTKQYRFTDEHPAAGINYYRLKQTDKDGKFNYSPIRKLNFVDNDFTVTIKPNPVTKGAIYINSTVNCNRIELRDATGRLIKTAVVNGMQAQLPVQDVTNGIYFITVITGNGTKVEKIIIQ